MEKCNKVFSIMRLYIKYLSSIPLSSEEEQEYLQYAKNSITRQAQAIDLSPEQYLNESDYSVGDMVLQFDNPELIPSRDVFHKEAATFFEQVISSRTALEIKSEMLDDAIFELAFQYVFTTLDDGKARDDNFQGNLSHEKLTQLLHKPIYREEKRLKRKKRHKEQAADPPIFQSSFQGTPKNLSGPRTPQIEVPITPPSVKLDTGMESFLYSTKTKVRNDILMLVKSPVESEAPSADPRNFQKRPNFTAVSLTKAYSMGEYLKKVKKGKSQEIWRRTGKTTKDFMTLMRNCILLRLSHKGFMIRTFLSKDGKYIYAVLYSSETNLAITAELTKLRKFLNIEFTDIFSYEPVDQSYRPYRLNNRLWRESGEYHTSEYFKYLKPKILDLLARINFKKISKELNIQNINDSMFSNGRDDIIGDEEGPTDQQWEAYYEYLLFLEQKIQEARKKFYIKIEFAVLLNPKRIYKTVETDNQKIIFSSYEQRENRALLITTLQERYEKQRKDKKDGFKATNEAVIPETNKIALNQVLYKYLVKILDKLNVRHSMIEQNPDKIISKARSEAKAKIKLYSNHHSRREKSSRDKTDIFEFYQKIILNIFSHGTSHLTQEELTERIQFYINSELIRLIARYLDENDKWIVLSKPNGEGQQNNNARPQSEEEGHQHEQAALLKHDKELEQEEEKQPIDEMESDEIYRMVVEVLPKLILEQQEIQDKQFTAKVMSLSKEIDTDYVDQVQKDVIQQIYMHLLVKEIDLWGIQIEEEKKQFLNLKDTLHLKSDKLCTKFYKEKLRQELGQSYGKAFQSALSMVKYSHGPIMKCLWDYEQFHIIQPSFEYLSPTSTMSFKKKCKILTIWRKYQISESGRVSNFSIMERLKLVNLMIYQTINVPYLLNGGLMSKIFALNDHYELFGKSSKVHFSQLADSIRHRVSVIENSIKDDGKGGQMQIFQMREQIADNLFVEPKLYNLKEVWSMRFGQPWYVPAQEVRNYYGEKIALYFIFLGQYTEGLLLRGVLGLMCTLVQSLASSEISIIFALLYGMYHTTFLPLMLGSWKIVEKRSAVQFGQDIKTEKMVQEQRPAFQGSYRRNPVNDELNTLYFPFYKLILRMALNLCLLMMVFSCYLGAVIGLFYLTKYFDDQNVFDGAEALNFLKLEVSIPCIINVIILNVFDQFYESLAEKLTEQENHQTVPDFEANFILKKFTILLLSYFAPIFMITFLNAELGIDCAFDSCWLHGSYYFSSIFILLFLFNAKEILEPIIGQLLAKTQAQQQEDEKFASLNLFIHNESTKESYMKSVDRYGTVDDYMEIIIQTGLLALFGPLFPASIFVAFIWNVIELQTDKNKLLLYSQRPAPLDESSIGIWNVLLEFLSNFSIIYNTGLMYMQATNYNPISSRYSKITVFLAILLTAFIIRYLIETLIPEIPFELQQMIDRQKYLLKSTIESFKKKVNKQQKQIDEKSKYARFLIYKPYGTVLVNQKKKIGMALDVDSDDVSSLSDDDQKPRKRQAQQQEVMILADKKVKVRHQKTIHYFDFMRKRFESGKQQRLYNERVLLMKRYLKSFEKNYKFKWCEQRFLYRRFQIRRSHKILKHLNIHKLKIYWECYKTLFERFMARERAKLQKQFLQEEANNAQLQKAALQAKRKAKQNCRKVVILKTKGVWFSQFRRQVPLMRSKELIKSLRAKHYEHMRQKNKRKIFSISNITVSEDLLIKDRKRIFDQIAGIEMQKTSPSEIVKLMIRAKENYQIRKDTTKTDGVRNIEQLYSLSTRKIEQMENEVYHHEFPSKIKLDQEEFKNLFLAVNQLQAMRNTDFTLIKPISGFQNSKYPYLSELFENPKKPTKQTWLILSNFQMQILEVTEIRVGYSQQLNDIQHEDTMLAEFTLLDQFMFPYSKGIVGRFIKSKHMLLYGWSLKDTIKLREALGFEYEEYELIWFLTTMLEEAEMAYNNQILTPTNIVAYLSSERRVGYQFVWQVFGNSYVDVNSFEFLLAAYESYSKIHNQTLSMVYNMGMIMIYMMTLGRGFHQMAEVLEKQRIVDIKSIQMVVADYIVDSNSLMQKYPIVFSIVQEMLLSESQRKSLGSAKTLCRNECKQKGSFFEKPNFTPQLENEAQKKMNLRDQLDEIKLYDPNEMLNQHYAQLLHFALSRELYKLDILYKFKLLFRFQEVMQQAEEMLSRALKDPEPSKHILNRLEYFCDKKFHQKIMLDVLELEFYRQLHFFSNQLSLEEIVQGSYIPNFPQAYLYIQKIQKYTSSKAIEDCKDQNDILLTKKRLRINQEAYGILQEKIQVVVSQLVFLNGFAEQCKQAYDESMIELKKLSSMSPEKLFTAQICIILQNPSTENLNVLAQILSQIKSRDVHALYNLRFNLLKSKILLRQGHIQEALSLCHIDQEVQCIFDQSMQQRLLIQLAEVSWCLDRFTDCYLFVVQWINRYRKSKCKDLAYHILIYAEKLLDLLFYNQSIPLVEDLIQLVYQLPQDNFLVNYLQLKLLHVLNQQSGVIASGLITIYDENSLVAETRTLEQLLRVTPHPLKFKDDFLSVYLFEIHTMNPTVEFDYLPYLQDISKPLFQQRLFIVTKLLFATGQYSQAKVYVDQMDLSNPNLLAAWKLKVYKLNDNFYQVPVHFGDFHWKQFFISCLFALTNLNAQLACQLAFRIIEDLGITTQEGEDLYWQMKVIYSRLLLKEYSDPTNRYVEESFQIKYFILQSLNSGLSDICTKLIEEVYQIEDNLKIKELKNYKDPTIILDKQAIEQKTKYLNDLIVIQSQLLEESGDPVAALKCLDVQYALLLYDEKFQKQVILVFSRKLSHNDPNFAASRCKIAILRLFLNLFEQSTTFLQKARKLCLDFCVQLVTLTIEANHLSENEVPQNKVIWDSFAIQVMNQAKPLDCEAFQKYKLIYYMCELKLLESYVQQGNYKDAMFQYLQLLNHYDLLTDPHVRALFEYSFGVYELNIWQTERAQRFFNRALHNLQDLIADKDAAKHDEIKYNSKPIEAPFRDPFSNPEVERQLLEHLNHRFTLKSRCQIGYLQASLFLPMGTAQYQLFPKLMLCLETIRKTMGRHSILYADALIVYVEYLLRHMEQNRFQDLKIAFKTLYFQSRKMQDYFKPGITTNTNLSDAYGYIFYSIEEIESRFTQVLIQVWIEDLLIQTYDFYVDYFKRVNIVHHMSIIHCSILLHRIYFLLGRIYNAQDYLKKALDSLEVIHPNLEHPFSAIIFERQAMLQENMAQIIDNNIKIILECQQGSLFNLFKKEERVQIVKGILLNDDQLSRFFDEYKQSGFELYLFQKLETYLGRHKIDLKKVKQYKNKPLEFTEVVQIRERAKHLAYKEKSTLDMEVETIAFYRRAYRICKQIFKDQNHLFKRIEDRFIHLSREEAKLKMK